MLQNIRHGWSLTLESTETQGQRDVNISKSTIWIFWLADQLPLVFSVPFLACFPSLIWITLTFCVSCCSSAIDSFFYAKWSVFV